jgi:HlyD family secretion protein
MNIPISFRKPLLFGSLFAGCAIAGIIVFYTHQSSSQKLDEGISEVAPSTKITALGRLEPQTEVISLSAPVNLDGDRVAKILVKQGDRVKKGQIIAVLDSGDRFAASVVVAEQQITLAQVKLAQVRAGAKSGEIAAQNSEIARLKAELAGEMNTLAAQISRLRRELENAQTEFQRYQQLAREGAITDSLLDSKRLTMTTASDRLQEAKSSQNRSVQTLNAQINEAQSTLAKIAEVRPIDVKLAETEVVGAISAAQRAKVELEQAFIKAPLDGQILKIYGRVGEKIGDKGIADFGQTAQMVAVAEVYQTEVSQLKIGQPVIVTGSAFTGELKAKVTDIGLQVSRQNVFANQPGENMDRRVVEVKATISPEGSQKVAGLTNLQVQVAIALSN